VILPTTFQNELQLASKLCAHSSIFHPDQEEKAAVAEEEEDRLVLVVEETGATESARPQESAAASLDGVAAVLSIVEEALEACKEALL